MEEKNVLKLHKEAIKFYVTEAHSINDGIFKYTNLRGEGVHYDYLNEKGIMEAKNVLKKYLKKQKESYNAYREGYTYKCTIEEYLSEVSLLLKDNSLIIPDQASKKRYLSELNTSI